ncbi:MAG TPA: redox-sensitive transcriptional activator SoxR [Microthrixaceae bacterium]|nr:redox-sensitive transcriptional activator SoxR [Microthrixaceae bacterium]
MATTVNHPDPDDELSIGAVATRSGLAVSALRFYESHGLITSRRTDGGQRRYPRDVLRRLAVIRAAQQVGFHLSEIVAMVAGLPDDHHVSQEEWRDLAASWRPALDERIRTLERLRDQLDRCIGCGCLSMKVCQMANPDDEAAELGPGPAYWMDRRVSGAGRRAASGRPGARARRG